MPHTELSLTRGEYNVLLYGHSWIRSVDPYASLSRGWVGLVDQMLDILDIVMEGVAETHLDAHAVHFTTKSKFGTLRVHFALANISGPPNAVWPLLRPTIDRAEQHSARICEQCGAPGRIRDIDDWLMTLCDVHASEQEHL